MTTSPIPTDEEFLAQLRSTAVPANLHEGIMRWTLHGIEPGSFLRSIIQNDLQRAVLRADYINERLLPEIVQGLMKACPEGAFFNPRALVDWPMFIQARKRQEEIAPAGTYIGKVTEVNLVDGQLQVSIVPEDKTDPSIEEYNRYGY